MAFRKCNIRNCLLTLALAAKYDRVGGLVTGCELARHVVGWFCCVFVFFLHFEHLDIFYHQLPCICHQSIFVVVPSQSCARRRSSMHRTAFDLETARKVHLHHFLSRHHNLFFSNSDLLPYTLNCSWQFSPSSTLLESSVFVFVAPCLSFRCVVKQCSDI